MAQNSIARLAVQIVTDTAGMNQGFRAAQAQTIRFASSLDNGNARLLKFGKLSADAAKSFSGLGGPGGLAFKFAGLAGPVGLAAAAVTALAVGITRAATASEDFRIERLRELGRLSPDIQTTKEAIGGVTEQLSVLNEILFKATVGDRLKGFSNSLRNAFKNIGETFAPESFAKITAERAIAKDDSLLVLKRKADELVKTLRTPSEVFGDSIGELLKLREEGFITSETLSRGALKAAEDYRQLTKSIGNTRKEVIGGGAALEAGSQAARAFVFKNTSAAKGAASSVDMEIAATLRRIEVIERDKKPVEFKKGSL